MSKKLERKQQRRAAEERRKRELQRAARRRNLITGGIIAVVAALVVGAIYYQRQQASGPVGVAAGQAGCTEIEEPDVDENYGHVPDGTRVDYSTDPPTSGDHYDQTADPGFNPPQSVDQIPTERFVHNMEHGQIIFWYRPDAPEQVIQDIEDYIDDQSERQEVALLAVPYEGVDSSYSFATTAWGASQSCERFSETVTGAFRETYQGHGPENPAPVAMPTFDPETDA